MFHMQSRCVKKLNHLKASTNSKTPDLWQLENLSLWLENNNFYLDNIFVSAAEILAISRFIVFITCFKPNQWFKNLFKILAMLSNLKQF